MATKYLFSNNATTTLAQSISATATVINVASGEGSLFPSPGSGEAFPITLVDSATELKNEICYCTARSGDQLTVTRGQENTNAVAWSAGDIAAHYITAGTIENWLQESDLDGYATEAWASDAFVGRAASVYDYTPLQAGVNKSTGEIWLSYLSSSGTVEYVFAQIAGDYQAAGDYQPAGDYALQSALASEISRAEAAETALNDDKVNRAGDTMTGSLYNSGGYNVNYSQAGTDTNDVWYNGFTTRPSLTSAAFSTFVHRTRTGKYDYLSLQLTNSDGGWQQLEFRPDGRLYTTGGNTFALTSELPTSGTITGGTYTKVPMNDGTGRSVLTQSFLVDVTNGQVVDFPVAYESGTRPTVSFAYHDGADDGDFHNSAWANINQLTNTSVTLGLRNLGGNNVTGDSTGFICITAQGIVTS